MEGKINGFDDAKFESSWQNILKESRKNKVLTDDFFKTVIERIKQGLTTFDYELNSIPDIYREKFIKLYKKDTNNK